MRNQNRRLAAMLSIVIALGDFGGMTALATENIVNTEASVSENTTVSEDEQTEEELITEEPEVGDMPSEDEVKKSERDIVLSDAESDVSLPALHIGQISEGEPLPTADDDAFIYDLPLSFETGEYLILFVNYDPEITPDYKEAGTLEWSILRGEKGLEAGSTNLLNEEDDWNGFVTVPSSPYFSMEKITDSASDYYEMMTLVPKTPPTDDNDNRLDASEEIPENYDYYIRAAYYPKTETGKAEAFYTAATIPFTPQDNAVTEADRTAENPVDAEEALSVSENSTVPGNSFVSENSSISENSSVPENSAENTDNTLAGDALTENAAPAADEANGEETAEHADSENTETNQDAETFSTVSGNSNADDASMLAGDNEPPLETETVGTLTLYQGTAADEKNIIKDRIPLSPKDTLQITAKASPETLQTDITWDSSDEKVAAVEAGQNGTATITAAAEGYAQITASCRGITSSFVVDVVPDKNNPEGEKLLDLSGDIRVAGFVKESDDLVYSGQKITQSLRVYHNNTLLKEKTDYTLSYKNNVNAAAWNSAKAPSVTINLKGQYQGRVTLYYTIRPLNINDIDIYNTPKVSPAYEQTVNYSKKLSIPAPVLTYGKKKLAVKRDFVCDYTKPGENMTALPGDYKNGDLYTAGKVYSYTVNGTGNFTGSFPMQLVVLKDKKQNFGAASVKLDQKQYEYHGMPLTKSEVHITEVKISGQVLAQTLYDYDVYAPGTEGAYVMVSPTAAGKAAGYSGCKKIALKLVGDRQLKDAVPGADWKPTIPFSQKTVDKDGGMFQTGPALLSYGEGTAKTTLAEGTDYTIKYGNAKKAGKVTATFTGKGRYKGSLRLTYSITANTDIKIFPGENVTVQNGTYEVAYQKGGAVPGLILRDQNYTVLKNKTDYTISYKDNKTPGTPMTCEIKGKGNYSGYEKTVTLMVTKADIGKCTISIPDKPYSDKPNRWKSTVTIKDVNGKKLTAKTDYDANFTFSHTQEQSPQPNTTVSVTVTGLGCYEKTITGTYRIFAKNISTLKVVIDPREYTGEEITLTPVEHIHLYTNNTDAKKGQNEIKTECYIITEYQNNIRVGTAKVTLRGIGEYGGTKTYSFKIQKKKYQINHVKSIKLDKSSLSLTLTEPDQEKRTITATITAETNKEIANPTVIWTSSNSSIVSVEEKAGSAVTVSDDDQKTSVSVSAVLTLKKGGTVTITAASQDGNKKAQCRVSVTDAPVLLEAGQTVQAAVGKTCQLHMLFAETQNPAKLTWSSNNPDVISVAKNEDGALLTMHKAGAAIIQTVYTSGNNKFTQQCYALAVDPNEKEPEGNVFTYEQEPGCTDDTPHINKLLNAWRWDDTPEKYDTLYLPAGIYHINPVPTNTTMGGISLNTGQNLIMSSSALLIANTNSSPNYQIISVNVADHVTISGGQIIGDRSKHKGGGEAGHGIGIDGSTNVTIKNVDISQCWGDGIYLGWSNGKDSDGVTIEDCVLHHNRRSNLSVTEAHNVTIKNCAFNYASGTSPQYGINIEPNHGKNCSNVTISSCTFKGNAKGTIQILAQVNAHIKNVTIENCKGDKAPVKWSGFGGSYSGVTEKGNQWN